LRGLGKPREEVREEMEEEEEEEEATEEEEEKKEEVEGQPSLPSVHGMSMVMVVVGVERREEAMLLLRLVVFFLLLVVVVVVGKDLARFIVPLAMALDGEGVVSSSLPSSSSLGKRVSADLRPFFSFST
jgi:hypothetical protein